MMKILLRRFSLMFLLLFLNYSDAQDNGKNPWALRMVYNVQWDLSDNYLAVLTEDAKVTEHLGKRVMPEFEGAKMSFFYGLGSKNMLIDFNTHEDTGAAYCEIGVITDEIEHLMTKAMTEVKEKNCSFVRQKAYKHDGEVVNKKKYTAFCPLKLEEKLVDWIVANGTFNRPAKSPQCLYDFHTAARANSFEYDLLRYCAKGYFFNGKDYDHPANIPSFRKDWLLYLAEGSVTCGISGNSEEDKSLLAKGYTVELVHRFDFEQFNAHNDMVGCPEMSAILTSYQDDNSKGKFFFAAVVGAGQLDGHFQWSDRPGEEKQFWDEETYKEEYKTMTLGERGCYLNYHNWGKKADGRYFLELRVTHHCTGRAMRETISFDVSTGPENAPEGFHEDKGILIDISAKMLRRTTGQTLCAKEMPLPNTRNQLDSQKPPCVLPPRQSLEYKGLGKVCNQKQTQCPLGTRCTLQEVQPSPKDTNASCPYRDPSYYGPEIIAISNKPNYGYGDCVCRKVQGGNAEECKNDWDCVEYKYCANGQCKKMHYKEFDEPCYSAAECFPGFGCFRDLSGLEEWGHCDDRVDATYSCLPLRSDTETPRDPLKPCEVPVCPRDTHWGKRCAVPPFNERNIGELCEKHTYSSITSSDFGQGLEDCIVRLLCCT